MVRQWMVILFAGLFLVASGCSVEKPAPKEAEPKSVETLDEAMACEGRRIMVCYKGGVYVTVQGRLWHVRGSEAVRVVIPEISRDFFTETDELIGYKRRPYFFAGTDSSYVDCGSEGLWHLDGAVATKVQEKSKLSPQSADSFTASPAERRILSYLGSRVEENRKDIASLRDQIDQAYSPAE